MRFQLELELIKPEFPADYSRLVISFLKESIQSYHSEIYKQLFETERGEIKSYTFDVFLNQAKFESGSFKIKGNTMKLTVSSCSLQDSLVLQNAFLLKKGQFFNYKGDRIFKVGFVRVLPEVSIKRPEVLIKWMSPLVVLKHEHEGNKNHYFSYADENFIPQLKWTLAQQLEKLAPHLSLDGFDIEAVQPKKVITTAFGQKFSATKGVFKLKGTPELLKFFYEAGMGSKRNAGFGMFEIL